jgi:DNA polymerase III subunit epsilon
MYDKNYAIVDVETTGGSPVFNRVIEIGILRVEKGEVVARYESLVNPEMEIPEFITNLTGITNRKVKKAPHFEDIKDDVLNFFQDAVFVAHNCAFDYGFLKQEFKRSGYAFRAPRLCTVNLSRTLFPKYKHHNLSAIIERFEFSCKNRHRAYDDAQVLWDFFRYLPREFSEEEIGTAVRRCLKKIPPSKQRKMAKTDEREVSYVPEELALEF